MASGVLVRTPDADERQLSVPHGQSRHLLRTCDDKVQQFFQAPHWSGDVLGGHGVAGGEGVLQVALEQLVLALL